MLPIYSTVCVVMSGFQTPRGTIEQILGFMKVNLTNGPVVATDYAVKCLLFIINICLDCLFIDIKVKILCFKQIFGFVKVNLTNGPVFARDFTVKCLLFIIYICLDCLFIDILVKILCYQTISKHQVIDSSL